MNSSPIGVFQIISSEKWGSELFRFLPSCPPCGRVRKWGNSGSVSLRWCLGIYIFKQVPDDFDIQSNLGLLAPKNIISLASQSRNGHTFLKLLDSLTLWKPVFSLQRERLIGFSRSPLLCCTHALPSWAAESPVCGLLPSQWASFGCPRALQSSL